MTVPTTLEEALLAMDSILSDKDRTFLNESPKSADDLAVELHHSLGRHLRNSFGLWGEGSALANDLKTHHGVSHPDDMSHHIIVAYCHRIVRSRFERIVSEKASP